MKYMGCVVDASWNDAVKETGKGFLCIETKIERNRVYSDEMPTVDSEFGGGWSLYYDA